jgi:hypothetical protein
MIDQVKASRLGKNERIGLVMDHKYLGLMKSKLPIADPIALLLTEAQSIRYSSRNTLQRA